MRESYVPHSSNLSLKVILGFLGKINKHPTLISWESFSLDAQYQAHSQ